MAERYRFRTPGGEVYESDRGKAWIERTYPGALIVGRVAFDEAGAGTVLPYRGEQPAAPEGTAADEAAAVSDNEAAAKSAPATPRAKKER